MAKFNQEMIVCYTRENGKTISAKIAGELVRCKDCKHHHYQDGIPYCDKYYWGWKDDDFCSYGERKDGRDG